MSIFANRLRQVIVGALISAALAATSLSPAQQPRRGGGGNAGRVSRGGARGHAVGQARSRPATQFARSRTGTSHARTTFRGATGRSRTGPAYSIRSGRTGSFHSTRSFTSGRGQEIANGRRRGYTATSWRHSHPDWNGNYYYRDGAYYYDSGFAYPAIVTNEWENIAIIAGGVALLVDLRDDPTLYFEGSVGAFYPLSTFYADRHRGGRYHLRYLYFDRPYFWRDGIRFVRITVTVGGRRGYEFRRD